MSSSSTASTSSSLPPFLKQSPPPATPPSQARLSALYASTSTQRHSNPTGYEVNSQWWASVLEIVLLSGWINGEDGDRLLLKVDDALLGRLEDANGGRPKGIGGVVERLASTSLPALHPITHFLSSPTPLHASPSLTYRLIGRPLYWALSQLNPFGSDPNGSIEKEEVLWKRYSGKEYVHMPLLEQAAALFTAYMLENPILSYSTSLHSITTFHETFSSVYFPVVKNIPKGKHALSRRDCEILLKWLGRDCGVIVTDGTVIKLLEPGQKASDHPITEADVGTLTILETIRKVEIQIEDIEKQIAHCQSQAKHHLSLSQKPIALSYLRSKTNLTELLQKRLNTSTQLSTVLSKIDQAQSDIEIIAAYETSSTTLSSILANPKLDRDHVDKTMEGLSEVLADQEDIDTAIRVGLGGRTEADVDEEALGKELEMLVMEEKEEIAAAETRAVEEEKRVREAEQREKREKEERERIEKEVRERVEKEVRESMRMEEQQRAAREARQEKRVRDGDGWEERYANAQEREREEKVRAEAERLRKDAARVVAE